MTNRRASKRKLEKEPAEIGQPQPPNPNQTVPVGMDWETAHSYKYKPPTYNPKVVMVSRRWINRSRKRKWREDTQAQDCCCTWEKGHENLCPLTLDMLGIWKNGAEHKNNTNSLSNSEKIDIAADSEEENEIEKMSMSIEEDEWENIVESY